MHGLFKGQASFAIFLLSIIHCESGSFCPPSDKVWKTAVVNGMVASSFSYGEKRDSISKGS